MQPRLRRTDGDPARRLLVVDDDPALRGYVRRCVEKLRGRAAEVVEARDGIDALEVMERLRIDLVVCDMVMPRMGGLELLEAVRRDSRHAAVPVLLLTGQNLDRSERERLAGVPRVGLLDKPFNAVSLCGMVDALLAPLRPPPPS